MSVILNKKNPDVISKFLRKEQSIGGNKEYFKVLIALSL